MPPLIEFPADDLARARLFWEQLLEITLAVRHAEQGRGLEGPRDGVVVGLHERGAGPGDRAALPYFPVSDLKAAVARVLALGGTIVHPGAQWVICRDSEGSPFGLSAVPTAETPD